MDNHLDCEKYDSEMPITPEFRLSLIRTKTEWAKKNIKNLEVLANKHIFDKVDVLSGDSNSANGRPALLVGKMPFDIVIMAGDIIHNLRSALDHLAFNLVQVGGKIPTSDTGFPIAATRKIYESTKSRKVRGMTSAAKNAIDDLCPYGGGNELLWRLHHLDIVDKHREFVVVAEHYVFVNASGAAYVPIGEEPHFAGIFATDSYQDFEISSDPSLTQPKIPHMQPLIPSLHELSVVVENLVEGFLPLL